MFEREIMINNFLLEYFKNIVKDIPDDKLAHRPPGNGHPPLWILGHLGLCPEFGESCCGIEMKHPEWMNLFGPGTPDEVPNPDQFSKEELVAMTLDGYPRMHQTITATSQQILDEPHGLELLDGTPIATRADLIAHLLTSHFSFHLAQLSGWRRAHGMGPLF